ncbi:hypothetical protein MP228_003625 [Amoeboaphelidium protococcarum]|nr:hypothetical protein MP228_003625 [Amoeboaphelidium protococcarum]
MVANHRSPDLLFLPSFLSLTMQRLNESNKRPYPDSGTEPVVVGSSFSECEIQVIEQVVADALQQLCDCNDNTPVTQESLTRFHSRAPPQISILSYIKRIVQFSSLEKSVLLMMLIYIDRICSSSASPPKRFRVSSLTVHRFIIACVTVTAKALCDSYCTNTHYARVGGISTSELNSLEMEFLLLTDWSLYIDNDEVQEKYCQLVDQSSKFVRRNTQDVQTSTPDQSIIAIEESTCKTQEQIDYTQNHPQVCC